MNNILIVTDSSTNISDGLENIKNLKSLPLSIILPNGQVIDDDDTITEDHFNKLLETSILKTSQTPIGIIEKNWDEYLETYEKIIVAGISKGVSNSYSTSVVLSQKNKYKNKVIIIDTDAISFLLKNIIIQIADYIKVNKIENTGEDAKKLQNHINSLKNKNMIILFPKSLETLKRGGRITPAVMILSNFLKINPVLEFKNGIVDKYGIMRTYLKGIKKNLIIIRKKSRNNVARILTSKINDQKILDEFIKIIKEVGFTDIQYVKIPRVILAHLGNDVLGVGIDV